MIESVSFTFLLIASSMVMTFALAILGVVLMKVFKKLTGIES